MWGFGRVLAALAVGLAATGALAQVAAPPQGSAAPAPPKPLVSCAGESDLAKVRQSFFTPHGPTPAGKVGMILPADGSARLLFKQPMGTGEEARSFRVFEVSNLNAATIQRELTVMSVDQAEGADDGRFKATDSVALTVAIPKGTPWQIRSFAVLSCKGPEFSAWGAVSAPVSNPDVTLAICVGVGVLLYGLAMLAVYLGRGQPMPGGLDVKYPSIFGSYRLRFASFFNPIHLVANAFNQASVQKAQVVLFSFMIGEQVLSLVLRTGALVDLSPTIIGLLGISGIGAATAQAAYQQKTRLNFENWAWLEKRHVILTPAAKAPQWRELVMTNREFDVYKLQTIIFTVAVAAAITVGGASHLATFAVPSTLLGVLGLSQVVYVGGVLVKPPAVADLDESITKLRKAGENLATAISQGVDTDAAGKLLTTRVATPGKNARRQYDELADKVEAMIESALEVPADRKALDPPPAPAAPRVTRATPASTASKRKAGRKT